MAEEKPFMGSYPNSSKESLFMSSNQPSQTDIPWFSINFPVPLHIPSKSAIMENNYSNTSENPSNLPVCGAHRLLFHNRGSLPTFQNSGLAAYDGRNVGNFILPQDPSLLQNSNPNKPFCAFKETSNFTEICCMIQKPTPRKGKWTEEETDTLRQLVDQLGENQWSKVAEKMSGRGAKQCKSKWINCEKQDLKKDKWSMEEYKMLIQAHRKFGNQWTKISKWIPGRSENNIKNQWYATKRQKLFDMRNGIHPGSNSLLWNYILGIDAKSDMLRDKNFVMPEGSMMDASEVRQIGVTEDFNYLMNQDDSIPESNKLLLTDDFFPKIDLLEDQNFVMPEGSMMDASEVQQIGVTEDFNYLMNQNDSIPESNKFLLTDGFFPKIDLLEDEKIVVQRDTR